MNYWEQRKAQMYQQLEKDGQALNKKLAKYYEAEAHNLEKDIAAYYQQYGTENVIEYRRLMQSLPKADKELLIKRMDDFAKKYPQYKHLMPVRKSIYKLDRLEGLKTNIMMQEFEIGAIEEREVRAFLERQALVAANTTAEELGFGKNFYINNHKLIQETINKGWCNGKNFSERVWGNREKLAEYLTNDFAAAVARSDSYAKCAKLLKSRFLHASKRDINRLVWTEANYVLNEASAAVFEEAGFDEYTFLTQSVKPCDVCKAINGVTFKLSDRMPGVNFPPMHPHCHCTHTEGTSDKRAFIDSYVKKHSKG